MQATNFIELLETRLQGDRPVFTHLEGDKATTISFGELGQRSRALAAVLQGQISPGDRVLLVYPPGPDYILAFLAVALSGGVAVPAVTPASAKALPRLALIAEDAGARMTLTQSALRDRITEAGGLLAALPLLATDEDLPVATWEKPQIGPDDLLFLQYTSGSTGDPKGVMVRHANVLANLADSRDAFELVPEDVIVSWLPPHHDFGLIGGILSPIFVGCHAVHLTPQAFLMRPQRWLKAISDWRATVTGGPDFAWQLCAAKIPPAQREGLDLSSLRVAINGAERVRPETLTEFSAAFADQGFDPGAFTPAYGLAEATLLVASGARHPGRLPKTHQPLQSDSDALTHQGPLVTSGESRGADRMEIAILGAEGRLAPEGAVGEIMVRGPSVAAGYWNKPAATAQVFNQNIPERGAGFLRTGDLGCLVNGELYVSGRSREMMIIAGRNIFPQDIEPDVEALDPSFRASGCAAFTVEREGRSQLVLVQEVLTRRDLQTEGLVERLRSMLAEKHGILDLAAVLLVRPGDLPRTTSGKIQRFRAARLFEAGELPALWSWSGAQDVVVSAFTPPTTPTEHRLATLWAELLEMDQVSVHDNFLELAGNSLLATQVISALHQKMGVDVSLRVLFENPTIAKLAAEIDRALAEQARSRAAATAEAEPRPISAIQTRLFYLDQFAPGDPIYNLTRALQLDGMVDVAALERAATELARRHEVLRYRFDIAEGQPVAVLMPATPVAIVREQAATLAEAREKAARQGDLPFDLLAGPMLRIALISEDEDSHLLVMTLHATIADELGIDLALQDLAALYSAYSEGFAASLPEPALQYGDFLRWQESWLTGSLLATETEWWRAALAEAPLVLNLPTDRSRPAVQSHRGAVHQRFLSVPGFVAGEAANARIGAAFAALLYRICGQDDLLIGLPADLRDHPGTERLIGPLTNTVVLRQGFAPHLSHGALLQNWSDGRASAMQHKALPFDTLLSAMEVEHQLSHSPLFQVMLDLRPAEAAAPQFQGLSSRRLSLAAPRAMYDLTLRACPVADGVEVSFEYSTDLFDAETIARLADHLQRCLIALNEPDEAVLAKPLPGADELAQIAAWNDTGAEYPEVAPLHVMFERQAAKTPDAIAVMTDEDSLTFAELNRRANRWAHHLRQQGVGPDCRVGLCIERSSAMMVALVAIHKAGGAYVPLDPALPANRLDYMIEDAAPVVILTTEALMDRLPQGATPVLCLDRDWDSLPPADENPSPMGDLSNLAYIIYTSGSTGQPKGVAIEHAGIANRLVWMTHAYGVAPDERVMQKTPYSFDVSVWELFWPLVAGATLVMARPGGHMEVAYLAELIQRARITTMHFVPPMLEFFLDLADLKGCTSLRQVLCSGQALPVALQNRFHAALPNVTLRNLYGPTEASVEVSHWDCVAVPGQMSVPIGHPIGNIRLYILDPSLNPVPVGVAGELYLAGIGLARGYVNRPGQTAGVFLPDPFGPPGSRMYRSGDLARHWPNGAVEYLGRVDDQVKIRGFRIELGEIEARLQAQPGLRDAFVMARDDIAQDRRLVAYLVAAQGQPQDEAPIKQALLDALPDYMVPAHFVWIDRLPVTLNGKVDRRALPRPDMTRGDEGFSAPQGETEIALARIWQELLAVDRVGRDDSFFSLGGHSLLGTQAISKIRAHFGVDIALRAILFDQPTVATLAPVVDAACAAAQGTVMTEIVPVPRLPEMELSFSQKRLWFLDQLEPGNPFYNIPAPTRLTGALQIEALRKALNIIVARHDQLRTYFRTRDDKPVQVLDPDFTLDIPLVDLSHLPEGAREEKAMELARQDALTPFQLDIGPPLRATLLKLGEEDHVILFNMHHIISDGWSMGVLVTEFVAIYRALIEGRENPLAPLAVQYVDFAAWQRDWLQGATLQSQLEYWRNQLADAPRFLSLPTDFARPAAQSYRGATLETVIPARLVSELYALGARHQATLFMTLLSAFDILLSRYARQSDLCLGTYIANRNRAEIEGLIGFFVNMLVLRSKVDDSASFEDLLLQNRDMSLDAYAHQDLPFEYLVDDLRPERHLSHSPLFQVVFVLQNTPMDDLDASGLQTSPVEVQSGVSKFDLTLRITEKAGQLHAVFEYATDLFKEQTIARMAEQFSTLLSQIVQQPAAPISSLSLVDATTQTTLLTLANGPQIGMPMGILEGFAAQVARQPDHPAIAGEEAGPISYGALDQTSSRMAAALIARGIGKGDRVALWLPRGADLVTAMLAVMKAGAAFVPLDPDLPPARRDYILTDAAPRLVLTETAAQSKAPNAVSLEDLAREGAGLAVSHLPGVASEDVAVVLYTSGTTGRPKGVVLRHHGLMVHAAHHIRLLGLSPSDRVLQFASPGFDTALEEILPTLMAGATMVPRPMGFLETGPAFDRFLVENAISIADLPTQFWHQWAQDSAQMPACLRAVILGGERLSPGQYADWTARADVAHIRLFNTYGPTEASIICTAHEMGDEAGEIPIGRAIDGVIIRLLDAHMQPVPPGVPGEIWLGGPCLAAGYLNRPDLTAERFLPDPFAGDEQRLYRTGDLARMEEDGTLYYLGRVDDQIKLRGFRIEPAEVETALLECGATAAFVMLREDQPGNPRLVAYVSGAEEEALTTALRGRLPGYMVPWRIVVLGSLPLTVNGKVDRRALPVPVATGGAGAGAEGEAPLGPVAAEIAALWAEVLGLPVDAIGSGDDFFALGGHSLLATQVISRLRSAFGIELPLRAMFEAPKLGDLAAHVSSRLRQSAVDAGARALPAPKALPRLDASGKPMGLALSFAQQRLWFLDQLDPGDAAYHLPVALRLTGDLDVAAFGRALTALLTRHEVLRGTFALDEGRPVQHILPPAPLDLPFHDLSALTADEAEAEMQRLFAAEAARPFDLGRDVMLRAALVRLGPQDHAGLLVLHHIASDGWSMGVLLSDIAALYAAAKELGATHIAAADPGAERVLAAAQAAGLPELSVQYADYAAWQRDWLQGPVLDAQLQWWSKALRGLPGLLALPTDHPRPALQSHRGAVEGFTLPAPLVAGLEDLARAQGATLHMTLVALLSVLLSRWSGQEDIALGTPVAGRRHAAVEPLVGFFVNTLVLRNQVEGDAPFSTLLEQVRQGALAAQEHQDLPFEHLVEALAPARDLSHAPLFQVMLALQNAPMSELALDGLQLRPMPVEAGRTKFDLTFGLQQMPEIGEEKGGHLLGQIEYATDLFTPETIRRLARQFRILAEAAVAQPDCPVGQLPLLDPMERERLIAEWQPKPLAKPAVAQTLDGLFAKAAARFPDRIALVDGTRRIDYATLEAEANALAHVLQARGVGPDVLVGLCAHRSAEMIISILAILKAGGAWVPLDPDHPDDRLAYMLEDAAPAVVLAEPALRERISAMTKAPVLAPNRSAGDIPEDTPTTRPTVTTQPSNLAYVIYTSGSTGRPKGVAVDHRAIVNRVVWLDHALEVTPEDRIVQKTPFGFDVSVGEIFLPLVAGGSLVMARPGGHIDVQYLAALVRDEAITIMHFVPPMVEASLAMADPKDYESIRAVMCSGQALPRAVQDRFAEILPHIRLHNLYGPTEAAVEVTHWPCDEADPRYGSGVPIGRAIDNVAIYILDDDLEPVPQGVPGHLFIAGIALARGYLNRPDLTAGAFIPDPFGPPGARMYRSGDRARLLPGGAIDYLGRADDQLKIRGVRIEPGEVEAAVLACGIRECVVLARPDQSGELGLIAYVVAKEFNETEMRRQLTGLLPDHLLPSAFVRLDSLPLTTNGKVDRKALPAPDFSIVSAYVAPRTPTEQKIAEIWAEVLGHERVGIQDNFFRLGGHSLRAVDALNRIRLTFGVELGLEKAFALQTVELIAHHVDTLMPRPAADTARKRIRI